MLPLRRLLNLIYHWGLRNADADQRAEVDAALADAADLDLTAQPVEPEHVPGTAPRHIRPPSWWKGNRAAFRSSVAAAAQLGEPVAKGMPEAGGAGRRRPAPSIGSRRPRPAGT